MNFKVGDEAVTLIGMKLWNNVYHWKNSPVVKRALVTSADDRLFTMTPGIDVSKVNTRFSEHADKCFNQDNGRNFFDSDPPPYRNLTANRKAVIEELNAMFDSQFDCAALDDQQEIDKLEAEIEKLQAKIKSIQDGKRVVSFEPSVVVRDMLSQSKARILKALE